jgi:hypothetical protein
MSDLEYKDKYLKYKNKYLTLKNQLDTQNNLDNSIQSGGNKYYRGTYVFFLNQFQTKGNQTIDSRIIENFNDFTDQLGDCAYFLRVSSTTTTGLGGWHDFDTIYPNKSSLGASFSFLKLGMDFLGKLKKSKEEDNLVGGGDDIPFEIKYLCNYKPIRLSDIGFDFKDDKGFKYTYEVEKKENLINLVKGVNKNILTEKFEGNQISTVLIINKLGNLSNDAEILKKYDITYSGSGFENPIVTEKSYT